MKVKLNDKVLVISGKDKGKQSRVTRVITKASKIIVEKVNMKTKHIKKTAQAAGEKITFEGPLDASNVAIICPSCNKPTRAGYKVLDNGKKDRICKKCKQSLDGAAAETSPTKTKKTSKKTNAI
ncbi:MAG: 50S ribosomal protein L24 [Candidatus Gracilibacteria bacterium]|jgi:large subunit ribosomal protein L24